MSTKLTLPITDGGNDFLLIGQLYDLARELRNRPHFPVTLSNGASKKPDRKFTKVGINVESLAWEGNGSWQIAGRLNLREIGRNDWLRQELALGDTSIYPKFEGFYNTRARTGSINFS